MSISALNTCSGRFLGMVGAYFETEYVMTTCFNFMKKSHEVRKINLTYLLKNQKKVPVGVGYVRQKFF